jgi:hypothetical protein
MPPYISCELAGRKICPIIFSASNPGIGIEGVTPEYKEKVCNGNSQLCRIYQQHFEGIAAPFERDSFPWIKKK